MTFKKGDRVEVALKSPHMKGQKTGTIEIVSDETPYGVLFDGMKEMGVHKWYVDSELKPADESKDKGSGAGMGKMAAPAEQIDGTRRLNLPLGQRLAHAAPSYNADARTVEIVIATETPVRTPGYMIGIDAAWYLEILDCRAGSVDFSQVEAGNCPLLDAHARWAVADQLGKAKLARCENNQVLVTGQLGQSDGARALEAEIVAGTAPKVSAGYSREEVMFERMEGETPVYRVTKWTLREASFVPIAADPNAGVRSAEQNVFPCTINEGNRTMPEIKENAAGAATETGAQPQAGAEGPGQRAAHEPAAPGLTKFTASKATAFVEQARTFGEAVATRARELVDQNERGEISVESATSQLLKASADAQRAETGNVSGAGQRTEVTADERDKFLQGASNSIIQRAGLTDLFTRAAKIRGETIDLDPGEFRGVRNAELARLTLEKAGVRIDSYDRDHIVGLAMTHRAGGMNTTSDFGTLLENTLHKTLQAAYTVTPDTWRRFCGVGSVVDFRAHPRYLRGTFGTLDSRTEAGEFKNKNIPDGAKESISASVKGNIIAITRDALVNDDLGAFNFLAVDLGRAAKLSVESDVYALLAQNSNLGPTMNDGNSLFHASHNNIGTGSAPTVNAFEEIAVLMAKQKDVSGNEYLDIRPSVLLVPIGLRGDSIVINDAQYDPDTASKLQKPNKVRGLFDDVVATPRLSGTRYYAFADPGFAPALEVVFLNGVQEPYLEQREGWRVDGTEIKVRYDYGVGGVNYRSAVTNAGA